MKCTFKRRWFGPDELTLEDGREFRIDGDGAIFHWPSCEWVGANESRAIREIMWEQEDKESAASRRKRWGSPL